jgi:hypothetical protein
MVRPWSEDYQQKFKEGSILFVYAGDHTSRMCVAADIPVLNYMCDKAGSVMPGIQTIVNNNGQFPKYDSTKSPIGIDPKTMNFKWNYVGVVRNDLMTGQSLTKLYNVDVHGRSNIANIFGPLKRGDVVGLALVKMDVNLVYKAHVRPNGQALPSAVTGAQCLQIVGTINGILAPYSLYSTEGNNISADGVTKYRVSKLDASTSGHIHEIFKMWPIGIVSHAVARVPSDAMITRACRDQDQFILLPRVEVLLH